MVYMIDSKEIKLFSSAYDLFHYAARDFSHRAIFNVNTKGVFSVVLSGGNTPKLFYDVLTEYKNIPWEKIQFFFGDERYVPSMDINSNYHLAYEHLFSKVPVNPDNIYPIPTGFKDPKDAAKDYEQTLRKMFDIRSNETPPFDLFYLGLGDNAHTASLMPNSDVVKYYVENLDKDNFLVASLFDPESNMYRVTLTPYAINNGMDIIFLVVGQDKASAVCEVLEGDADPLNYPAQLIHSIHGKTIWYLDEPAANKLTLGEEHDK